MTDDGRSLGVLHRLWISAALFLVSALLYGVHLIRMFRTNPIRSREK